MSRWLFHFTVSELFWNTGAKIRENIPTELYSHVVKAQFSGDKIPLQWRWALYCYFHVFLLFLCLFLSVCSTLRMRKHTSGDCRLSELVLSDSDYTTARYLSPDSKIVSLCVEQTGEVKRLTVAGSRWEEERGSSEEKKREERRGEGGDLGMTSPSLHMRTRCSPDLPGIPFSSRTDAQRTQES